MVIVLMGVSGSGKTVVGRALAVRLGWEFEDGDDWHPASNVAKMHRGLPLTDEDRMPWLAALARGIREWEAQHRNVVLACSALRRSYRDVLRGGAAEAGSIRLVYLHAPPELIHQRLRLRVGHFMPETLLDSQLAALEEPDAAEALRVDVSSPVPAIVDAIVQGLGL